MDISGFTNLSEQLSQYGREGTEILTMQISSYFGKALKEIFKYGGDVIKFGGDALTVLFKKENNETLDQNALRALTSSFIVLDSLKDYTTETRFGTFKLKIKMGISSGKAIFIVLGDENSRLEYVFSGSPLDKSAEAEHNANPSEIIIDKSVKDLIKNCIDFEDLNDSFFKLIGLKEEAKPEKISEVQVIPSDKIKRFLIPSVYNQIQAGGEKLLSEHRPVIPCFVSFPSINLEEEEGCKILQNYFFKVSDLLKSFGGSFNRMDMGDKGSKFLSFFGAPETYSDNEERAVAFALQLKKLEGEIPDIKGQSIGITSGIAYCGLVGSQERQEYTIMGDVVNVSARLMSEARGKILVSEEVRKKTRKKFQYSPKKEIRLKGKSQSVLVSTPLKSISKREFSTAKSIFVGRESELQLLSNYLHHSKREIFITGGIGIGKTAFVNHFLKNHLKEDHSVELISLPIQFQNPYFISRKILERVFDKSYFKEINVENLRKILPEKSDFVDLFRIFTGEKREENSAIKALSSQQKLETLSLLFSEVIEKTFSNQNKTIFIIDDYYRVSEEEKEFLPMVFDKMTYKSVKFVILSREVKEKRGKEKVINLQPFSRDEIEEFALQFFKASAVPSDLIDFLNERSSGTPLYISEILSILKEKKIATVNRDRFVIFNPEEAFSISRSIEDIILMRFDTLSSIEKNILKVSSCFGEGFESDKLAKVFLPELEIEEINNIFSKMGNLGIERKSRNEFYFSNKLLRETAYNSILVSNKKEIHRRIGEIYEEENKDEFLDLISNHFSLAEEWEKSFKYSLKCAMKSFSQQRFNRAQRYYTLAIDSGEKIGREVEEKELLNYLKCLISVSNYERAKIIIEKLKNSKEFDTNLRAKFFEITILDQKGDYKEEFEKSRELIDIAKERGNGEIVVLSIKYAISSLIRLGLYEESLKWLEKGYSEILNYECEEELPNFYILSGSTLFAKGDYLKAKDYYQMAFEYAKENKDYELEIRALFGLSNCHRLMNEQKEALEFAERVYSLSKQLGSRMNMLAAVTTIAHVYLCINDPQKALLLLKDHISLTRSLDFSYSSLVLFNLLGLTSYNIGDLKSSLRYFKMALKIATKINNLQSIVDNCYNICDLQKEMGQKEKSKKGLIKIVKSYSQSIDKNFLKTIASELLTLSENEKERKRFIKLFKETEVKIKIPGFLDEVIKNN